MQGIIDSPGPEGVFRLRAGRHSVYLLWRGDAIVLVGAGGAEHMPLIRQALQMRGARMRDISALLLTHADVQLNANASTIRDASGAKVYIHRLDAPRLALRFPRSPRHALRARMERRRAAALHYVPCPIDFYISEGDVLDMWYGLTALNLPGPTPGHCGYYCRHLGLLFSGALFEKQGAMSRLFRLPPFDADALAESTERVRSMKLNLTLPSVE